MIGMLQGRTIGRRDFLHRLALTAAAGAGVAITSACGGTATNAPGGASAQPAGTASPAPAKASAAPGSSGTLTWALWDKADSIDPATVSGASGLEVLHNIVESLIVIDADEKVGPMLATKWSMDDGGKKFTFTLRDDVKFHDGTMLDSTAVKRSWERVLDPATKAPGVAALFGDIATIDAPDPRTVVVNYKTPFPTLFLQAWRPYFGILSNKYLDTLKKGDPVSAPVGTGPFKFVGRSPDGALTLEAFPDYAWGAEGLSNRKAPYLQTIKYRSITENATRIATLESGENLLVDQVPEPDYPRIKADKRFRIVEAPIRSHTYGFLINVQKAPTNDKAVREAINWAVDRQAIVQKLYFGVHHVSVGPLSEGVFARLDELEKRHTSSYD